MFRGRRERRAAEERRRVEAAEAAASAAWEAQRRAVSDTLDLVTGSLRFEETPIVLKAGETVLGTVRPCSLVEDRRGAGHYEGRSRGISIPTGVYGIRYRVGKTQGTYVQGELKPTAIDMGLLAVTNQRAVFVGNKATRECLFSKLVAVDVSQPDHIVLSVSNRQKPTSILFTADRAFVAALRIKLGLAMFQGDVEGFASEVKQYLAQLDGEEQGSLEEGGSGL
jgi:hypothetical protein